MAAREWSGLAYAEDLMNWRHSDANFPGVRYFHSGLRDIDPPLGWSLSKQWRDCIDKQLEAGIDADLEISRLVNLLRAPCTSDGSEADCGIDLDHRPAPKSVVRRAGGGGPQ
jgi:hypothetical protein